MRPRSRRRLRIIAVAAATVVILIGAVLIGGAMILEMPSVTAQIQRKASQAVDGKVSWDTLQVRFLPAPRAILHKVHVEIPGQAQVQVEEASAYLRLWPLLHGNAEIRSMTLVRPVVRIDVVDSGSQRSTTTPDPIAVYRSIMTSAVHAMRSFALDTVLSVDNGSLEVHAADAPPVRFSDLSLRAHTDSKGVEIEMATVSSFSGGLRLSGRLELADLSGRAVLDVADLEPQVWLDRALRDAAIGITVLPARLHAVFRTDGRTALQCDVALDIPSLTVARGGQQLQIPDIALKGTAVARERDIDIALTNARLGALIPAASVTLRIAGEKQQPQLAIEIPKLELALLRESALTLIRDNGALSGALHRIRSGEISDLRFAAQADRWSELVSAEHIRASLTVAHGTVIVPVIEQEATALEGRVELAGGELKVQSGAGQLGSSTFTQATLEHSTRDAQTTVGALFDVDLVQAIQLARRSLSAQNREALLEIESIAGRIAMRADAAIARTQWDARAQVVRSSASVRARQVPWPISLQTGQAFVSSNRMSVRGLQGSIGHSMFSDVAAELVIGGPLELAAASGRASLSLDELYPWLKSRAQLADALIQVNAITGRAQVTLNRLTGKLDQPAALAYDVSVEPAGATIELRELPAPVRIASGMIHVDPAAVKLDRVAVAFLDAQGIVSGTLSDFRSKQPQAKASVAEGAIGAKFMDWGWQRAGAPAHLEPKTPLRISLQQLAWGPERALDVKGTLHFDAGPSVALDIGWRPGVLNARRVAITHARTDATVALLVEKSSVQGKFSGSFYGDTIAALLKSSNRHSGDAAGDLRFTVDRERPRRSTADGSLQAHGIDLSWLIGKPVKLEHIDLSADGSKLRIREAVVNWAEQIATIRGEVSYTEDGPHIDAQLDSPGVVLDALLPPSPGPRDEKEQTAQRSSAPNEIDGLGRVWPLPITGRVVVRSDFVQYERYRVAPVSATLAVDPERAQLDLHDARLCGIAFPLSITSTPGNMNISLRVIAHQQDLETAARCLSEERLLLTGEFDVRADLSTSGQRSDWMRNLRGPVQVEARNGRVMKFALLGNILALANVASVLQRNGTQLDARGFAYRRLIVDGQVGEETFTVSQSAFDSDALGLAATGKVNMVDRRTALTVLVAPFGRVDRLVRKLPIVGYVVGGTFTSIPVQVTGDYRDPLVVPLGAAAVTSELAGIFVRTLKLPAKILEPISTGAERKAVTP